MASPGCRKAALVLGIGCLGVPIALALVIALVMVVARRTYKDEGPPTPEATSLSVPVGAPPSGAAAPGAGRAGTPSTEAPRAPSPGGEGSAPTGGAPSKPPPVAGTDLPELSPAASATPSAAPIRLTLDLQEGRFIVVPGPPGSDIKVEGLFDPRDHELTQNVEEGGDLGREVTIRFRSKRSFLMRLLSGRFNTEGATKLTVTIPEGVPTALSLRLSKCESRVELGGLTLTELDARLGMGDQEITFERPLAGDLARASVKFSMGEMTVEGLGNAHPKEVFVEGSMGELSVDFRGEWPAAAHSKARIRMSMGEIKIRVPREVRVSSSGTRVFLGDAHTGALKEPQTEDPNAPSLDLDLSTSMGEVSVHRD